MSTLRITRGLPGSGKSTCARAWVSGDPAHRAEVNRDHLRLMMHDGTWLGQDTERQVIAARDAAIVELLKRGIDVVCSDTNLPQRTARDLAKLAKRSRAEFEVWDFTDVPLETCLERDSARSDKAPVGEQVIRDMHARYLAGRAVPLPLPEEAQDVPEAGELYEAKPGTPATVLVDIDGTVALHGTRSPFDETRVHEDRPNAPVVTVVRALAATHRIVFASGRTDACKAATRAWLDEHIGIGYDLYMRAAGDARKDSIVKRELFDQHIRERYDIRMVVDDRSQVVRMWRDLGLTVLQVADGDF